MTTSTYDGNGNLLTSVAPGSQWTTNTWDGENRLTLVALPSSVVDSFTYNGDGLRIQKQDSTGTTNHVWDGFNILLETNGTGVIQAVDTLEPRPYGNVITQSRAGLASYYHFDALQSTRQLTNAASVQTDSYVFSGFGTQVTSTGSTVNVYRYGGRLGYYYHADLGSVYLRARYYSPQLGTFLSRDPIGILAPSFAGTFNRYCYAYHSLIILTDASGLSVAFECSDKCGPDVTKWFKTQLFIVSNFTKKHNVWDTAFLTFMRTLKFAEAPLSTDNCPSGEHCAKTVSLCDVCIHVTELGNIAYGYGAPFAAWNVGGAPLDPVGVMLWGGFYIEAKAGIGFDKNADLWGALAGAMLYEERIANMCGTLAKKFN